MSQVNTTWHFKARRNGRCVLGIGKTCQKGFYVSLVSREKEQVVGSNQVILYVQKLSGHYIVFFYIFYIFFPYSFDARGRPLNLGIPWADESVFNKKAHFHHDTDPPALRIKNIQTSDAGLYKCRVDFHKSPTRNWRINVTVLGGFSI